MKAVLCLALLAFALSACAVGVGEKYFFVPKPAASIVADPQQIHIVDEEKITGPASPEGMSAALVGRLPATLNKQIQHFGKEGRQTALVLARAANAEPGEPLIVYCGGNASDLLNRGVYYVNKVLPWGELLMWDYPGFGHSNGAPWAASFDDVFARMGPWIDGLAQDRPLVLWGHSIGGLVCSRLATRAREVDAIILETTATSPDRIAKDRTWALPMIDAKVEGNWKSFNVPKLLAGFRGPVMVIGAGKDRTLPVPLAREVATALKDEGLNVTYREYPEAGHLEAATSPEFAIDASVFFAGISNSSH